MPAFEIVLTQVATFVADNVSVLFLVCGFICGLILWFIKPWRMTDAAATVVNTVLGVIYSLIAFSFVVFNFTDWIKGNRSDESNVWAIILMIGITSLPIIFYALLRQLDKNRDKPSNHPVLSMVLDYMGLAFFMGFIFILGFGAFAEPLPDFVFSLKFFTNVFLFLGGGLFFLRFVIGLFVALVLKDENYKKAVAKYYNWILYGFIGCA
ncbi:hypothetical protein KKG46_01940, partial [Patescibacteria group bacterium]|nr:hypothetical protein [Patescibacteria group bacterium]